MSIPKISPDIRVKRLAYLQEFVTDRRIIKIPANTQTQAAHAKNSCEPRLARVLPKLYM